MHTVAPLALVLFASLAAASDWPAYRADAARSGYSADALPARLELRWVHRLGNGRMISRWPARVGPLVWDDTVYYAAGIWPREGVYLHALDAASGRVRLRSCAFSARNSGRRPHSP